MRTNYVRYADSVVMVAVGLLREVPYQFHAKNILKSVPFVTNPAMERGKRLHDQMEAALLGGPVHNEIANMTPIVNAIRSREWDVLDIESENAIRKDMSETTWWDTKTTWCRIKMDFTGIQGSTAVNMDWKTGKKYGYTDQLKLYAGYVMHKWPQVQTVDTGYVYTDHNDKETKLWHRKDYNSIWDDFGERSELIQIANQSGNWMPKPSRFNCTWCAVEGCKARAVPSKCR